jgi:hypothetical protein
MKLFLFWSRYVLIMYRKTLQLLNLMCYIFALLLNHAECLCCKSNGRTCPDPYSYQLCTSVVVNNVTTTKTIGQPVRCPDGSICDDQGNFAWVGTTEKLLDYLLFLPKGANGGQYPRRQPPLFQQLCRRASTEANFLPSYVMSTMSVFRFCGGGSRN